MDFSSPAEGEIEEQVSGRCVCGRVAAVLVLLFDVAVGGAWLCRSQLVAVVDTCKQGHAS